MMRGRAVPAAAAHFGAVRDGVNGAVGVDGEIDAGRERALECDVGDSVSSGGSVRGGQRHGWKVACGQHESAGTEQSAEKISAGVAGASKVGGDIFDSDHETLRIFGDSRTLS